MRNIIVNEAAQSKAEEYLEVYSREQYKQQQKQQEQNNSMMPSLEQNEEPVVLNPKLKGASQTAPVPVFGSLQRRPSQQ